MRLLIILIFISTLWSCEKQREEVEKFVFDNSQISARNIHEYEYYDDGKIKIDHEVSYTYLAGVPIDSVISREYYQYNKKGKIISITDLIDSTRQINVYNELDTLTAEYFINSWGDTIRLRLMIYEGNKLIRTVNRMLSPIFPANLQEMTMEDFRNYDTLFDRTDLIYENDVQTKSLIIDEDGNITEEIHFIMEGAKQTKTLKYSFMGDIKYLKETTIFVENGIEESDHVTIDAKGDTIALQKTIFQDDQKVVFNYSDEFNVQDYWYYDKNGKLVGIISIDLDRKTKTVYSNKYDTNGNLIEVTSYNERLINTE